MANEVVSFCVDSIYYRSSSELSEQTNLALHSVMQCSAHAVVAKVSIRSESMSPIIILVEARVMCHGAAKQEILELLKASFELGIFVVKAAGSGFIRVGALPEHIQLVVLIMTLASGLLFFVLLRHVLAVKQLDSTLQNSAILLDLGEADITRVRVGVA